MKKFSENEAINVLMITCRADHGGGPRHLELLLRDLPDWIIPHVACPDDDPYWARFSELTSGRLFRIPHRRLDFLRASKLALYALRNDIQIIHAHGKGAGIYARIVSALTGIAGVHTAHGLHVGTYGWLSRRMYAFYENITSHWVNHLIHVSREEHELVRDLKIWQGVPASIITNGVGCHDAATIQDLRMKARSRLGIPNGQPATATISRFDYQKNMCDAYSIAKSMPNTFFFWIGTGEAAAELEARAASDGVSNLRFLGPLEDPLAALAAADVYLSTSRWEGLPLAVLEAMSLGIPSVLSDVTGHSDLVRYHGIGLLYPEGEVDSAASALSKILGDEELRRSHSEQALAAQWNSFSSITVAEETASVYARLANK